MNVLSLFDGMAVGLAALKDTGIKVDNYFSSEIDKYAISVAMYNHPEIKKLGTVTDYKSWKLPKIDLIIAGPPCQGFSIAGKGLDWNDPRSQLFFTAIEILWEIHKKNPDVKFLFENVSSMKKDIVQEINELMEVDSVMINSALVSAQNRKRNYWCNWDVEQPEDEGILLKDIIEGGFVDKIKSYCVSSSMASGLDSRDILQNQGKRQIVFVDKSQTIPATIYKENVKSMLKRKKKGLVVFLDKHNSKDGLKCVDGLNKNKKWLSDGKNLQRNFSQGERIYSEQGKAPTISAQSGGTAGPGNFLLSHNINDYRKLTVTECERLQTLPDGTTAQGINEKGELVKISNTQRYKMIGNGWTKDVISHIFSFINNPPEEFQMSFEDMLAI